MWQVTKGLLRRLKQGKLTKLNFGQPVKVVTNLATTSFVIIGDGKNLVLSLTKERR